MPIYTIRAIKGGKTLQRKQVTQGLGRDPVTLQAEADVIYLLADTLNNVGPAKIAASRDGANLLISLGGSSPTVPDIIIEGYFNYPQAPITGALSNGGFNAYDLGSLAASATEASPEQGARAPLAQTVATPVQASLPGEGINKAWLLGLGVGVLALGAAGGGSGGGASGIDAIKAYADDGGKAAPALKDYTDSGVKNVTVVNLSAINSAVDALTSTSVDSKEKVQAVVDAYNRILGEAGSAGGQSTTKVSASDFQLIGANIGHSQDSAVNLGLLNSIISNLSTSRVDTVGKINGLAVVVDKALTMAAGQPGSLTVQEYGTLGIPTDGSGAVTEANLAAVNRALSTVGGQAKADTFGELSGLVTAVVTVYNYADNGTQAVPTTAQYTAIGVTGVTDANVAAINSAVDSKVGADVDTRAKLQTLVDAYTFILAEANGTAADATPGQNPTVEQYAAIGAHIGQSATNPTHLSLLNDVIGNLNATQVDTIAEIDAIAVAVDKVLDLASGKTVTLTVADYAALGIPTAGTGAVTAINIGVVNSAIASAGGPTKVDTYGELSGLVGVTAAIYNNANDNTQAGPTVAQYTAAGIKGVTSSNVDAINNAVSHTIGADLSNKAKIQAVVDAYNVILAEANGAAPDATPGVDPTPQQYATIGADIGTAASQPVNLALLNDALGGLNASAVSTIDQINTLAGAANAVISGAAGGAPPTQAQLAMLGITGVTIANLSAVQQAIAATPDDGSKVSTVAQLQTVVTAAVKAVAISGPSGTDEHAMVLVSTDGLDHSQVSHGAHPTSEGAPSWDAGVQSQATAMSATARQGASAPDAHGNALTLADLLTSNTIANWPFAPHAEPTASAPHADVGYGAVAATAASANGLTHENAAALANSHFLI